ncbi:hypothetical protein [Lihuaxuella thermophila]|uniref:Uncharacterized protein n=1 Tax=Lihuaxuella thermophila TaxID=1173111 RepID=A0A1H8HAM4_9BACL|nr:hypothetical protein [Lihuaxuella thermophila]SEN53130.1 hypothetical protein SAMN05444955_113113 [Lihuaxuella thermophila]
MKPALDEKLISLNQQEIDEILTALETRIEKIEEQVRVCSTFYPEKPDLAKYWSRRLEASQSVLESFRQKVYGR